MPNFPAGISRGAMLRFLLALFLACTSALVMPVAPRAVAARSSAITMGNNAPEGPFTPIVLAGKVRPAPPRCVGV